MKNIDRLNEIELYSYLNKYGIKTPPCCCVGINEDLNSLNLSSSLFPAVIKIQSPKVVHKSDVGGVVLNVANVVELIKARDLIKSNLSSFNISLDENDSFIVTKMVQGEELYIGCVDDATFGHVILFGKGGIYLELYKDICYLDSNAKEEEILKAFKSTKISRLFEGYRGSKAKLSDVVELVKSFQKLILDNKSISELDINPLKLTEDGLVAVDARIKTKKQEEDITSRSLPRFDFFKNEKVAIIGASTDKTKTGYIISKNALSFEGELFFVNPKGGELFNKPLYKDIASIKSDIDTAVIVVGTNYVIPSIEELIPKKLKNLIIISAGFKESGHADLEDKIAHLAKEHNLNIIGPNCLGYYNDKVKLNATFGTSFVKSGDLALISQSGAVLAAQMDKAYQLGVGFSHLISVGNAIDLRSAELIPMLTDSKECKSISLYLEGVARGKELCEAIRHCNKPIYLFKAAKSEAAKKAAFSHTGNLSGNYAMFNGIMQSLGVMVVNTLDSLILAPRFHNVKNVAIITNAGGPGTVLTDNISARGKQMYELKEDEIEKLDKVLPSMWSKSNPIDIIGDALASRYEAALDVVDEFSNIDLIYLLISPQDMTDPLGSVKILTKKSYKHTIIPILIGGGMVREATEFCLENNILHFSNIAQSCEILN